nr:hypothetical protein Iba_scaffold8547CG0050 [Ipomoea batatas]
MPLTFNKNLRILRIISLNFQTNCNRGRGIRRRARIRGLQFVDGNLEVLHRNPQTSEKIFNFATGAVDSDTLTAVQAVLRSSFGEGLAAADLDPRLDLESMRFLGSKIEGIRCISIPRSSSIHVAARQLLRGRSSSNSNPLKFPNLSEFAGAIW